MKINGNTIPLEFRELELPRSSGSIRLRISAISVGVRRQFDAVYPKPNVPLIVTEGKNGRQERENWHDVNFRKALDEREYLQNIFLIYHVLKHDPNVVFDNVPTDIESTRALTEEFKTSGLSEGDLVMILKESLKASNFSSAEIDKAKESF